MFLTKFSEGNFATAAFPTPVLNSPDFRQIFGGDDGATLPLDDQGLLRAVETVILKGTKVVITGREREGIYKISTEAYQGDKLYVDGRFLDKADRYTGENLVKMPPAEKIFECMLSKKGLPYVWGGNWGAGIPEMLAFYPPRKPLSPEIEAIWTFHGLDCSGLLYEATKGSTPRNTSQLIQYGVKVAIQGKNAAEIQQKIKPLDLIAWKGHVVIAIDNQSVVESRAKRGVVQTPLMERLEEVMRDRKPVDDWFEASDQGERFVIRRWHPEARAL